VPSAQLDHEINKRLALGQKLLDNLPKPLENLFQNSTTGEDLDQYSNEFTTWDEYNQRLLRRRFTTGKVADDYQMVFLGLGGSTRQQVIQSLRRDITRQMRGLESIRQQLDLYESEAEETEAPSPAEGSRGTKIFVVHGHDGDVKFQVAEYLQAVTGQRPVILHEQADTGRTIIEKFEAHAEEAGFAVVLLTADDQGNANGETPPKPRARQNVVLELGYFLGKLGRNRVVALYETGVELPSDLNGLLYKPLTGNWHTELARELRTAGIDANLGNLP
jgi:predicted nucleotide-binding protein